jgi:hypothetical protein
MRLAIVLTLCGGLMIVLGLSILTKGIDSADSKELQFVQTRRADLAWPIVAFGSGLLAAGGICFASAQKTTDKESR